MSTISTNSSDFVVDVKRTKNDDGTDTWTAKTNGEVFTASTEEGIRDTVHDSLLKKVSASSGKPEGSYAVKLTRTWRVRIFEKDEGRDDDEDVLVFDLFA
jgi:hypothetical protein